MGIEKEIRKTIGPKKLEFIPPNKIRALAKEKLCLDEQMNAVIKPYVGAQRSNFLKRVKEARAYYQKEMNALLLDKPQGLEEKLGLAKTGFLELFKTLVQFNLNTQEPLHPISSKKSTDR